MLDIVLPILTSFFLTLLTLILLAKVAPTLGLVDRPGPRKHHNGDVPLVGGIAIFISFILGSLIWHNSPGESLISIDNHALPTLITASGILVFVGVLDDRYKLHVSIKILSEIIVALVVIEGLELNLRNLGALSGGESITLPTYIGYPFTIIAIFGLINAFNMLDGIDGLLPSLVLITLLSVHLFTQTRPQLVTLLIAPSLLAFLVSNMSSSVYIPKTFLGDAGSRLLGFIVACLLISASSGQVGNSKLLLPVTALYLVALPLYDMTFIVIRRIIKSGSPFEPDRSHIHHLIQNMGFSDKKTLFIILVLGSGPPLIGLILNAFNVREVFQFTLFLSGFLLYSYITGRAWNNANQAKS